MTSTIHRGNRSTRTTATGRNACPNCGLVSNVTGGGVRASTTTTSSLHQISHNNYEIQTQRLLQKRSGRQMTEKDRNSAKMLVILASGGQCLITFTLPRYSCTVHDLLEPMSIPIDDNTTIQCLEIPGGKIDFVVTVGCSENTNSGSGANIDSDFVVSTSSAATSSASYAGSTAKSSAQSVTPKFIAGLYAGCQFCGFKGCEQCKRGVFLVPPKRIAFSRNAAASSASVNNATGNSHALISRAEKRFQISRKQEKKVAVVKPMQIQKSTQK